MIYVSVEVQNGEFVLMLTIGDHLFQRTLPAASKEDAERMAAEVAKIISTSVGRVRQN